jgi:protein kinase A
LIGKVRWPPHIDPYAKDLIKRLLTADLTKRYGNLKGGVQDIKRHKWFADVDWKKMRRCEIPPPIVPVIKGDGDTSNFDQYDETNEVYGRQGDDPHAALFVGF